MQIKYLLGLCLISATYALPSSDCQTCGTGTGSGGSGTGGTGSGTGTGTGTGGGGSGSGGSGSGGSGSGGSGSGGSGSGGSGSGSGGSTGGGSGGNKCSTGPVQCCNQVLSGSDPVTSLLGSLLGLVIPIGANLGLTCNPISVIGIGSNQCNAQTVCCDKVTQNGLINIGCTPINLGL